MVCCASVSPDGRGVAAVAAIAASVMATWGTVDWSGSFDMLTPLGSPDRAEVGRPKRTFCTPRNYGMYHSRY
ncbi:hypothetical protein GCM10010404_93440 [Nonomuraea africana]